jgi:hypothetical protein
VDYRKEACDASPFLMNEQSAPYYSPKKYFRSLLRHVSTASCNRNCQEFATGATFFWKLMIVSAEADEEYVLIPSR